jgi:hypothetical protein
MPSSTPTQERRGIPGSVLATRLMALALLTVAPVAAGHARGMAKATRTGDAAVPGPGDPKGHRRDFASELMVEHP